MPIIDSISLAVDSVNVNLGDLEKYAATANMLATTSNAIVNSVNAETATIVNLLDGPGSSTEGMTVEPVTTVNTATVNLWAPGSEGFPYRVTEVTSPAGTVNSYTTTFYYQNATYPYVMTSYNKVKNP